MYVCIKKQTRGRSICIDKRAVNPSGVKVLDLWRIRKNINAKTMFLNLFSRFNSGLKLLLRLFRYN